MQQKVIDSLNNRIILSPELVLSLKRGLQQDLPDQANHPQQLAKRIHVFLDQQLPSLEQNLRHQLRMSLLQRAIKHTNYHLNAMDVINTCAANPDPLTLVPSLNQWLIAKHGVTVSTDTLATYIQGPKPTVVPTYWTKFMLLAFTVIIVTLAISIRLVPFTVTNSKTQLIGSKSAPLPVKTSNLPRYLLYQEINEDKLYLYLTNRGSLLVEVKYRKAIKSAAQSLDINPLLLYAIIGQEQGFVSRTNPHANKIANNPFNVYHSWQEYNTTIEDSAAIAARTVVNLSADRPPSADPIQWLNRRYAEDKNWWRGVQLIFRDLETKVGYREELH